MLSLFFDNPWLQRRSAPGCGRGRKALETREKLGEDSGRMEIVLRGAPGGEEAR